ncbi:MAG: class I SAM-dependent methyltransferase [Alicyclobacillus sp.]|nr:class I SAM-dependent methyltransferase [Alicyclobacillus sp.]
MGKLPFEEAMNRNAVAWDEVTPIHQSYRTGQATFFANGGCQLDVVERQYLPDLRGRDVAHLCCNCGQDTLSLVNLGAQCTGFDLSRAAIEEARSLSTASGVPADFVHANVLDIPSANHGRFDLVYISKGALVWLPDLDRLMANVSALLRPGGTLFLYDQHPFLHLLDNTEAKTTCQVVSDYFQQEPEENYGLDYIGNKDYPAQPNYQFMVRLSDLLNGLAQHNLHLTAFHEFDHCMYPHFPDMVKCTDGLYRFKTPPTSPKSQKPIRFPIMMLLTATKAS